MIENVLSSNYIEELNAKYTELRNFLFSTLEEAGLHPVQPQGAFYIACDITNIQLKPGQGTEKTITKLNLNSKDWNFCRWLTTEVGVAAIPCSAFYTGFQGPDHLVRFAFCKPMESLQEARKRLLAVKHLLQPH